jgi:phosphoribosylformylglycinamidine synthase
LSEARLLHSACDVSDGGLAIALAKACLPNNIGVWVNNLHGESPEAIVRELFGEDSSLALISCAREDVQKVKDVVDEYGFVFPLDIGVTVTADGIDHDPDFEISFGGQAPAIQTYVSELRNVFSKALESQIADELVTA